MYEISLDSWIIQDGNYPDFKAGEISRFALEAAVKSLRAGAVNRQYLKSVGRAYYQYAGRIMYIHNDVFVLDLGELKAYCAPHPDVNPEGLRSDWTWIEGELVLGVDPFFYVSDYSKLPDIPALIYPWRIQQIQLETTPWKLTTDEHGGVIQVREEGKRMFNSIFATDAAKDDGGDAHYVLHSEKLDEPGVKLIL